MIRAGLVGLGKMGISHCAIINAQRNVELLASTQPQIPIRFLGQLSKEATQTEISYSRLLVLPSECFEGFPMVVQEAFAAGTPTAVSEIGPLPSIVTHGLNGLVFTPGDVHSLLREVRHAWTEPKMLESMGLKARTEFEANYTEESNYQTLMSIYTKARERNLVSKMARCLK